VEFLAVPARLKLATFGSIRPLEIVSDKARFERELLVQLGMDAAAFQAYRDEMRECRDKFVAHLDELRVMQVPRLDTARAAVGFYHAYIADNEAQAGDLTALPGVPAQLQQYHDQCMAEVTRVYRHIDRSPLSGT
jgi:hypothetical protein